MEQRKHDIFSSSKYGFYSSWQSFLYFEIHVTKAVFGKSRRKKLSQNPEETGFPSNIQAKTRIL